MAGFRWQGKLTGMTGSHRGYGFGCPAKGALQGCAGSALLREPEKLGEVVRTVVDAVAGRMPVTAKIRAGFDDASRVEEIAATVEANGASMLTVHCRTKKDGYCPELDWTRIARAVRTVDIPVCGNGGVASHADFERMREELLASKLERQALLVPVRLELPRSAADALEGARATLERAGLEILPPEALQERRPDDVLLLPWNFEDEIVSQQLDYLRAGGRFLIPVPEPRFVTIDEVSCG